MKSAHFFGRWNLFWQPPIAETKKWTSRQIRSLCSGWRERFPPQTIATSSSTTFSSGHPCSFLYLGGENCYLGDDYYRNDNNRDNLDGPQPPPCVIIHHNFYHVKQASCFYYLNLWLLRPEYLFCLISKNKRIPSAHNLSNPSSNNNIPLHIMRIVCKKRFVNVTKLIIQRKNIHLSVTIFFAESSTTTLFKPNMY